MIPVVSLAGYSNSGKTTVMANLIRIFKSRGYKVAALKHAAHGYNRDTPGTDTWQYAEAGADTVAVAGPESFTIHELHKDEISLQKILDRIQGVDIILVEGFKSEPGLKIEVYRQEYSRKRIPVVGTMLAIVSDVPVSGDLQQFSFNELENLTDFIIKNVI